MEIIDNRFTLEIIPGAFPLSTDSIALADFVRLPRNAQVLDLGSGCGTLGLMLCAKDANCQVTGIELDESAHNAALKNSRENQLEQRLESICSDLTLIPEFIPAGSYDVCVSNPPYFTSGPHSRATPLARHEQACSLEELVRSAAWALKYGGDFYLVHKPERLSEIFVCATQHKLEPKRLCLLRHRQDGPVTLILIQCRKGAKPGLLWEDAALFAPDGSPTTYHRKLYHQDAKSAKLHRQAPIRK